MFLFCLVMGGLAGSLLVCDFLEHHVAYIVYRLTDGKLPYWEWKKKWDL